VVVQIVDPRRLSWPADQTLSQESRANVAHIVALAVAKKHVPFVLTQTFVMGTDSYCGTAGLPLPNRSRMFPTSAESLSDRTRANPSSVGERVGVRGNKTR